MITGIQVMLCDNPACCERQKKIYVAITELPLRDGAFDCVECKRPMRETTYTARDQFSMDLIRELNKIGV